MKDHIAKKKKLKVSWRIILILLFAFIGIIFLVPLPYTAIEVYIVQEPYMATETYTDVQPYTATEYYSEQVPITEEECKTDISIHPMDYLNRGLDNLDSLLKGNIDVLLKTCQEVIKYRTVQKSRDIIKYRDVQKERQVMKYHSVRKERSVTKLATLYQRFTGQVQYYYEV